MITNAQELLVDKAKTIFKNYSSDSSLNLVLSCSFLGLQYKAENLKLFNPQRKSPVADYLLVMTASNVTQANAMAESILRFLKTEKIPYRVEGLNSAQWILIDIQDIFVHIFLPEARSIYNLDELYSLIPKITIPEEFYTQEILGKNSNENSKNANYQDYF
jgi:ribosome-associated protein